ncbi:MAG TPA: 2-amino-4-hydroxy-6-hydroxymethyldihydropteridine diphosphokinase [Candidatus Tumulicola sp.]|nr:2-amino-4-hydroxy-6-hydroxymethyldihydropteridine diphosphokinase [Candidatus Tumulicola sp.]
MNSHRAYVGLGANLGDPASNVLRAFDELCALGDVRARSSLYRTRPWGNADQPDFVNAVALLATSLTPPELLAGVKGIEARMGRIAGERWGPRTIDLDVLTYDEVEMDLPGLRLPHRHLYERAFVLVPLAEIDDRYEAARAALPPQELDGVALIERSPAEGVRGAGARAAEAYGMSSDGARVAQRVAKLARFLAESGAVRVRIERGEDEVEVARSTNASLAPDVAQAAEGAAHRIDTIKAELVGVFRLSRPIVAEGELLEKDRELAYIEALGIRNPVHSLGAGRVVAIASSDGAAVEYGQPLFLLDRG